MLARRIKSWPTKKFSYRFVLLPETIGSITYLSHKGSELKEKMVAGFSVSNIGHNENFCFKESRNKHSLINIILAHLLKTKYSNRSLIKPYAPVGSDERQYCSPGFDLPVGSSTRGEMFFDG